MAIIFWPFLKQFLKRKFHTFPSIFYMMAQPPFRWAFFCPKFINAPECTQQNQDYCQAANLNLH
jgi:hypothetical protein